MATRVPWRAIRMLPAAMCLLPGFLMPVSAAAADGDPTRDELVADFEAIGLSCADRDGDGQYWDCGRGEYPGEEAKTTIVASGERVGSIMALVSGTGAGIAGERRTTFVALIATYCPESADAIVTALADLAASGVENGPYADESCRGSLTWQTFPGIAWYSYQVYGLMRIEQTSPLPGPSPLSAPYTAEQIEEAMIAEGLECHSPDDGAPRTLCFAGQECSFTETGNQCGYNPDEGPATTVHIDRMTIDDPSISPPPLVTAQYSHLDGQGDQSGASGVFLALVEIVCPGAVPGVEEWLAAPSQNEGIDGEGCTAHLRHDDLTDAHQYWLTFSSTPVFPGGPTAPPAAPAETPAVATPAPAVPSSPEPSIEPDEAPLPGTDGTAAPGDFLRDVPEPAAVSSDPAVVVQSALLALAIVFLMPFPAQLFNSTVESNSQEIRGWFAPVTRFFRGAGQSLEGFWRSPLGVGSFLVVSALLYGLLDPGFSLSTDAIPTLVALASGIVIVTILFAIPLIAAHRRTGERPIVEALPGTLLVGAACVLVSRLADFQPGYLYGLVIGFAFAQELDRRSEGRNGALAALLMLAAAAMAWIGLGVLRVSGAEGFGPTLLETVLAAVLVAGLEGVVFGLLPLRFLPGEPVYRWNRVVWGALLGIGLFAFFHILINPASGYLADGSRTPVFTILSLFLGFAMVSVALWAYFRFRPARTARHSTSPE